MESDANPMHSAHAAPRCTATAKATGLRCRSPAVTGWKVCRMHGARGGAREGRANPGYKHGLRGEEYSALRRLSMRLAKGGRSP